MVFKWVLLKNERDEIWIQSWGTVSDQYMPKKRIETD